MSCFDDLIDRYRRLLADGKSKLQSGWGPSPVEAWKLDFQFEAADVPQFLANSLSAGTINPPDRTNRARNVERAAPYGERGFLDGFRASWQLRSLFHKYSSILPAELRKRYTQIVGDDGRFGIQRTQVNGLGDVTDASIRQSYYALHLSRFLQPGMTAMEIGAGYGGTAARLHREVPSVRYVITDLPLNLLLAAVFLEDHFPGELQTIWLEEDERSLNKSFVLVAPWLLPTLDMHVDLALNTMSFQHMSLQNLDFYGEMLERFTTARLYHVNRTVMRDPTDIMVSAYPFRRNYTVEQTSRSPLGKIYVEEMLVRRAAGTRHS
jgi:hypothetical protein